ncbi:MAG: metal ABC transporter permease [Actinomycetota bacterium]
MNVLVEPFTSNEFLLLALVAGCLVSVTCAIAGTFVVLRGLAFVGDALAHGVLPGIALAVLLGFSGVVGAAIGAGVMMGGVGLVERRLRLSGDTAVGLLFVGMLSLGVIITSKSDAFVGDLTRILFGQLLGVDRVDLAWQLLALFVVGAVAYVCRRPFLLLTIDDGLTRTSGFSVRVFHNLLLLVVAITVVASFQTVGTLLVLGMLVAPAATGSLFARRIESMMLIATVVGIASTYVGLLVSYHFDLAAGASIVLTAVLIFAVSALIHESRAARHRHDELPHAHGHIHV